MSEAPKIAGSAEHHLEIRHLRTTYGHLRPADHRAEARLLASIAKAGQQTPIVVAVEVDGSREVIDGFRRLRALRQLAIDVVVAVEWPASTVDALLELRRTEGRTSTAILEEGWLIAALVDLHGLSLAELALRFGRSKTWIHSRLSLVRQLPDSIAKRVLAGELSGTIAWKIVVPFARANAEWVEPLCQSVIEHGLTSRQAEAVYQALTRTPDPQKRREILDRPSRVLDPPGDAASANRNGKAPDPLDVVERLDRWCRHARAVLGPIHRALSNGASEDTIQRLIETWQDQRGAVHGLVRRLDDLVGAERPVRAAGG
jgi:ParB/RepB/Spo0J family partition protein